MITNENQNQCPYREIAHIPTIKQQKDFVVASLSIPYYDEPTFEFKTSIYMDPSISPDQVTQTFREHGIDASIHKHRYPSKANVFIAQTDDPKTGIQKGMIMGGELPQQEVLGLTTIPRGTYYASWSALKAYKISQRPEHLKKAWNANVHQALNDIVALDKGAIDLRMRSDSQIDNNLQDVFGYVMGRLGEVIGESNNEINQLFTHGGSTEQVLEENYQFVPNLFINTLRFISNHLHPIGPEQLWTQEKFDKVDWDAYKKMIQTLGFGPNGSLGGSILSLSMILELQYDEINDKFVPIVKPAHLARLHKEVKARTEYSRTMQEIIEALSPLYKHIWILPRSIGHHSGAQRMCPILDFEGIPVGDEHAFNILSNLALDTLQTNIAMKANQP